jgi:hypothetical protein
MLNLPRFPPLRVEDHGGCLDCQTFRLWLVARDRSERILDMSGTSDETLQDASWLRRYYEWGPSKWPAHWCDFISTDKLDCAAFANIVRLILRDRSLTADRLQIIELATAAETTHWTALWQECGLTASEWIIDASAVYHEGLVLHTKNGPVLYDTTTFAPVTIGPTRSGTPLWLRYCPESATGCIIWQGIVLPPNTWIDVRRDGADLARLTT